MYFVVKLKLNFGEKFTKFVHVYLQHQHEQITIQPAINIKDVSWKIYKCSWKWKYKSSNDVQIEIIKWQNIVNTHFKQCFKLNPLTKLHVHILQ